MHCLKGRKKSKSIRFGWNKGFWLKFIWIEWPTVNSTQQPLQVFRWDGLECDIDDIAHEFPDWIEETFNIHNQIRCRENFRPEQFKVAFLQNVGQFNNITDCCVFHLSWQQETFAQCEIGMRQIGECFQQNQVCNLQIQQSWIELVWLQNSQIHFQVVAVAFSLFTNMVLKSWQMLWIVSRMERRRNIVNGVISKCMIRSKLWGYECKHSLWLQPNDLKRMESLTVQLIWGCLELRVDFLLPLWQFNCIYGQRIKIIQPKIVLAMRKHTHTMDMDIKWIWRGLSNIKLRSPSTFWHAATSLWLEKRWDILWQHCQCCEFGFTYISHAYLNLHGKKTIVLFLYN